MKKVLYSPGYGAGWSTWNDNPQALCEYAPIIEALEAGDKLTAAHPVVDRLLADHTRGIYLGGLDQLEIKEVNGRYRIEEYDGSESVIEEGSVDEPEWFS